MTEFPIGWDMCRDCGDAHREGQVCPRDCSHERRTDGLTYDAATCLDCGAFVALVGEEDEMGRPTWDVL